MKFTTRLAVLLGAVIAMFSMLGIRLWFIQVAEGAQAAVVASEESWIVQDTPAPRGEIRDRDGVPLASSRIVPAVVVDRHFVTSEQRADLVQRLSALLDIPPTDLDILYEDAGTNGKFTVAIVDAEDAYRLAEQVRQLPGVRIEKIPERVYLAGESLAHVVGHLGLPTEEDLDTDPTLDPNNRIGKLGVERVYDEFLQGTPGEIAFRVNRSQIVDQRPEVSAIPGNTVYLTIDSDLQVRVEQALVDGIVNANNVKADLRAQGKKGALNDVERAAAVVLDIPTGQVLAMASVPTFNPSLFVGGLDPDTFSDLQERQAFNNLAVSGLYPPASTFKVITYMAELEAGIPFPREVNGRPIEGVDPDSRLVNCDGRLELPGLGEGEQQIYNDWYLSAGIQFGWSDEHSALANSCNIYFYTVALGAWNAWKETPKENVIQDQARALGYGEVTGIDLTGEAEGLIPDRALYESYKEAMLDDEDAPQLLDASRMAAASPWFGGDLMLASIGQGGVLATPLQVAASYAALANGGKVHKPYVVGSVRDGAGDIIYSGEPEVISDAQLDPDNVASLLADLNRVVTTGTASGAFTGFGDSLWRVGGKTGTGQSVKSKDNHAWFAGVAPIDNPRYAVAVLVDEGGSGGQVAAPIARQILQYLMGEELDPIIPGQAAD
ncbi:MAG: penicillin-binding transpeptidase domain-containing protein [Acidimicrobiia bacterium]|nr:penicillin-binding transpeptidase domain-containing protein [Acidimicrobiia bacterium]